MLFCFVFTIFVFVFLYCSALVVLSCLCLWPKKKKISLCIYDPTPLLCWSCLLNWTQTCMHVLFVCCCVRMAVHTYLCTYPYPVLLTYRLYQVSECAVVFFLSLSLELHVMCADLTLWWALMCCVVLLSWFSVLWSCVVLLSWFSIKCGWVACFCSLGFLNGTPVTEVHLKETPTEPQAQEGGCACWVL